MRICFALLLTVLPLMPVNAQQQVVFFVDQSGSMGVAINTYTAELPPRRRVDKVSVELTYLFTHWPVGIDVEVVLWSKDSHVLQIYQPSLLAEYFTSTPLPISGQETNRGAVFAQRASAPCVHYVLLTDVYGDDTVADTKLFVSEVQRVTQQSYVSVFLVQHLGYAEAKRRFEAASPSPRYSVNLLQQGAGVLEQIQTVAVNLEKEGSCQHVS